MKRSSIQEIVESEIDEDVDLPIVINWKSVDETTPIPAYIQKLLNARDQLSLDNDIDPTIPPKVDVKLLKRGQEVLKGVIGNLAFPVIINTGFIASFIPILFRTIFRDAQHSGNKKNFSYHKLIQVVDVLLSWVTTDYLIPGTKGHARTRRVKYIHRAFLRRWNSNPDKFKFHAETDLENLTPKEEESVRYVDIFVMDVESQIKTRKLPMGLPDIPTAVYFNQLEMVALCTAFVCPFLIDGHRNGINTVEKRRAVICFFRMVFSTIGIDDEYNIAIGSVEEVQRNIREVFLFIIGPYFRWPENDGKRNAVIEARKLGNSVHCRFFGTTWGLFVCDYLQRDMPNLWAHTECYKKALFYFERSRIYLSVRCSPIQAFFNLILFRIIKIAKWWSKKLPK